jgi:hypothetical protein
VNSQATLKFAFLHQFFTEKTLKEIVPVIQESYYMPNQIIVEKSSASELSLFVVANGEVEVLDQPNSFHKAEFAAAVQPASIRYRPLSTQASGIFDDPMVVLQQR